LKRIQEKKEEKEIKQAQEWYKENTRGAIREEFVDPGSRFNPGFLG
jgi:hypothetical protein